MAIQNANLMEIALNIGDFIKNNDNINEFVREQFDKELTVAVGEMLQSQIPVTENTPYIVLFDWDKKEGIHVEYCTYSCVIAIGVGKGVRNDFVEDKNGVLFLDAYDVSQQFTQLVISEINNRNDKQRPLSVVATKGTYPIEPDGSHWRTFVECTWRVYQTMGFNQEEF